MARKKKRRGTWKLLLAVVAAGMLSMLLMNANRPFLGLTQAPILSIPGVHAGR